MALKQLIVLCFCLIVVVISAPQDLRRGLKYIRGSGIIYQDCASLLSEKRSPQYVWWYIPNQTKASDDKSREIYQNPSTNRYPILYTYTVVQNYTEAPNDAIRSDNQKMPFEETPNFQVDLVSRSGAADTFTNTEATQLQEQQYSTNSKQSEASFYNIQPPSVINNNAVPPPQNYRDPITFPGTPERNLPHNIKFSEDNGGSPPLDRGPPPPDDRRPPQRDWDPPAHNRGAPPPHDRRPPSDDRRPPPRDWDPPPHERGPPPRDWDPPPNNWGPPPPPDRGPPPHDRGPPPHDWGPPPHDRGPPRHDRGPTPRDWGPPHHDWGPPPHDWGPPPHDRGPPPHDRGPPPRDWSPPPHDRGNDWGRPPPPREHESSAYYDRGPPPPPPHDRRPPPPPPHDRGPPPHDRGPPPPPPHDRGPPPHDRGPPPPPPHDRGPPPHDRGPPPPPPHDRGPPPHDRGPPPYDRRPPPPPPYDRRPPPPPSDSYYDDRRQQYESYGDGSYNNREPASNYDRRPPSYDNTDNNNQLSTVTASNSLNTPSPAINQAAIEAIFGKIPELRPQTLVNKEHGVPLMINDNTQTNNNNHPIRPPIFQVVPITPED